ncbi:MAG: sulfotransferase [Actinomycetota bacterium]
MTAAPGDEGRFDADELIERAIARHVGEGRIDNTIHDPLRIVTAELDEGARLTSRGRTATLRYLERLLDGHLALDDWERTDSDGPEDEIRSPIFVVGAPRTGTTLVHRVLARHRGLRAAEGWEFLYPLPTPLTGGVADDRRIALAAHELTFPQRVRTGLRNIHVYSAHMPKECLSAMAFSLRTEEFISRYHAPGYAAWLRECDMTPAYCAHRRVLRALQARQPDTRWVLKSPVHLQSIPTLVATYPDARFVVTHREPAAVLASVSSLVATLRLAFADSVDREAIGRHHLDLYAASLTRLVDHVDEGVLPRERTVHVRHEDLVTTPEQTLSSLYEAMALGIDEETRRDMLTEIADPRDDNLGSHQYAAADYGLDADEVAESFQQYRERFVSR